MLHPLALHKHVDVITHMIEYIRQEEEKTKKPVYLQIDGLQLTPELELDLDYVGLACSQTPVGCLISWKDNIEIAKSSYAAEKEYTQIKKDGPSSTETDNS